GKFAMQRMAARLGVGPDDLAQWGKWLYTRLPGLVNVLLVLALAHGIALTTWRLMPHPAVPAAPPVSPAAKQGAGTGTKPAAGSEVETLASLHLFGLPPADDNGSDKAAALNAPETQLNLTLRGVVASSDESGGWAIIAAGGGDEKSYTTGDTVPGGATINAIYADRVILSRSGRLETLKLPKDTQGQALTRSTPVNNGSRGRMPDLSRVKNTLEKNPQQLTEFVRPMPAKGPDGKLAGYRVYPGANRTFFMRSGLRPGDLVTAVNGMRLDDPATSLQLLRKLKTDNQINLTIQRDGREQTVVIPFSN
ncbi:MAG: type II secretion system protein GspC, partial [Gammaproteobacteria bacterium]